MPTSIKVTIFHVASTKEGPESESQWFCPDPQNIHLTRKIVLSILRLSLIRNLLSNRPSPFRVENVPPAEASHGPLRPL